MRDVIIKTALNGYVVRVSCQRVVFCDRDQMLRAVKDYLENPEEVEAAYTRQAMNAKQLGFSNEKIEGCAATYTPRHVPEPVCETSYQD